MAGWRNGDARAATLAAGASLALALAVLGGCSGEGANPLGSGLEPGPRFDTLLVLLRSDSLVAGGQIEINDPTVVYDRHEVLYCGRQGSERSTFLARFDFSSFADPFWDDVDFSEANLVSVRLRLFMLKAYIQQRKTKRYEVFQLAAPLDAARYPGPEPDVLPLPLTSEVEEASAAIRLDLPKAIFLQWAQAGVHNGIMVAEGAAVGDTNAGVMGFASRDFKVSNAGLLELESAQTVLGPIMTVEFVQPDTIVVLQPFEDVSTLSSLAPLPAAPAEGLVVRTHLRSYPFFSFALDSLPGGALIHRATLMLHADPARGFGPSESVVCSEWPSSALPAPGEALVLARLGERARVVDGRLGVVPDRPFRFLFNVTSTLQRHANGIFPPDDPVRFILTAGEDFTGRYDAAAVDPEFFLGRLHLWGTAAADSLRPRLLITFTPRPGLDWEGR